MSTISEVSPQPGHMGQLEAGQKLRLERRMGYWRVHHQPGIPGKEEKDTDTVACPP